MDLSALSQMCAAPVHPVTMAAIVRVESGGNPYAIGVVGGQLERQPRNLDEAVATAKALEAAGYNFSLGLGQVNRYNLGKYGLDYASAFDACSNLRAGASILKECFDRARARGIDDQQALQESFSCYYSGNFSTGFVPDFRGQPSYVAKVLSSAAAVTGAAAPIPLRASPAASKSRRHPAAAIANASASDSDSADDAMVFR